MALRMEAALMATAPCSPLTPTDQVFGISIISIRFPCPPIKTAPMAFLRLAVVWPYRATPCMVRQLPEEQPEVESCTPSTRTDRVSQTFTVLLVALKEELLSQRRLCPATSFMAPQTMVVAQAQP